MLLRSLGAIGLVGDGARPGADIIARLAAAPGEFFTTPQGEYKLVRTPGGAMVWLHLAPKGVHETDDVARRVTGVTPFHEGVGSVDVEVQSAIELDRNDPMAGGWVLALPPLANGDRPLPVVLEMVPFRLIDQAATRFKAKVRVLALAAEASVYGSDAAYLDRVPMAKLIAIGGVAPLTVSGGAEPKVAAASELRCVALITGRINDVRQLVNPLTGQGYFWLNVATDRGPFNIVANARGLLGALPVPGAVVQAKARLVATLADRVWSSGVATGPGFASDSVQAGGPGMAAPEPLGEEPRARRVG